MFISARCNNVSAVLLISMAVFALPVTVYLAGAKFVLPLCMPFSVNREIIERAWVYPAVLIVCVAAEMFVRKIKRSDI